MLRNLRVVVLAVALVWSGSASAGLNIEAPGGYVPGDAIEVTLTGDSEGSTATIIRAVLTVDPGLVLIAGAIGTLRDSSPTFLWSSGGNVGTCGDGGLGANQCLAVDAFEYSVGPGFPIDLLPSTLSTFTFDTTNATGDLFFSLDPDGAGFFGLPGTTVVVALIPEPATGLLLALGLVGLAGARRTAR